MDKLIGEFDGDVWAKEFVKMAKDKPEIATDVDTMRAWFANAIMAGYDTAIQKKQVTNEFMSQAPRGMFRQ